ncbi:D-Ala-D-Ala carboxypeptidase [Oscillospiraceae bacterium]|nr:D-Ala-D-Ala carboxypeptidase [Oscillospiraceae bacterium]
MKKYRSLPPFFLALVLALSLFTPALAVSSPGEEFSPVNAASAILIDADYDEVLYEQAADELRYPASITKVMTGLLTVEAVDRGELSLDAQVTLGDTLYTGIGEGGSTQDLKPGEILTVRDLLNCALIPSANEACNALAVVVAGSIPAFVDLMNQRAAELGMDNTHFVNTHGYHDDSHYTTARDISRMCLEAMKHPDFRDIVSSVSYTVPATNLHAQRELHDTNALVSNFRTGSTGLLYRYAIGIKTGSTPEAGYCLASAAEKNGRTMIAVVLGGENWRVKGVDVENNYFTESKRLLEYGFNAFSRKEVLSPIDPVGTIPVSLCAEQDYVTVQPALGLEATLPNDLDPAVFDRQVTLPEALEAPIAKGQVLGSIALSYEGKDYGTVDLVATTALERSQFLYVLDQVQRFFGHLWVKIALLAVVVLILILVVRHLVFGSSRRNRRGGSAPKVYRSSYRGKRR